MQFLLFPQRVSTGINPGWAVILFVWIWRCRSFCVFHFWCSHHLKSKRCTEHLSRGWGGEWWWIVFSETINSILIASSPISPDRITSFISTSTLQQEEARELLSSFSASLWVLILSTLPPHRSWNHYLSTSRLSLVPPLLSSRHT